MSISPLYGQVKTHNIIAEDSLTILKDTIDKEFDFNTNSVNATGADGADFTKVNFYPPEAASLMRYVNYPVSQLTGIPDIRIPLYTLKSGDVEIPMELSFHTDNYLRVNQLPGVAGAGWSLTSDLQITRSIRGFDDFKNSEGQTGYYYNTGRVIANYTGQTSTSGYTKSDYRRIAQGYIDMEPDKFYYRLPGKSGAFYFQKQTDGSFQPVSVPYNGVKISFNPTGQVFTLVDTDGTSYVFSASNKDYNQYSLAQVTMSWKCEKIINKLGQTEVTFTYGSSYTAFNLSEYKGREEILDDYEEYVSPYSEYHTKCNDQNMNPVLESYCPWWQAAGPKKKIFADNNEIRFFTCWDAGPEFVSLTNNSYDIGGGAPSRIYCNMYTSNLTEITFRGGKINFTYTDNHILNAIQIKKSSGDIVKNISLVQANTSDKYQRTLTSLTVGDEKYSFSYGANRKGGVMADFWGYDGFSVSGNYVTLPTQQVEIKVGDTERFFPGCSVPDEQTYMVTVGGHNIFSIGQERTLLTINYPTGGRAEFVMGQNRFRDNITQEIKGSGGYRIEKIRYYDSGGNSPVKEQIYKYGSNEDGNGIPHVVPVLSGYGANTYTEQRVNVFYGVTKIHSFRRRVFSGETVEEKTFDNGGTVNYDQVTEYEMDNGSQSGKIVYTSDLHSYTPYYASPTSPYPLREDEWYMGMPESVVYYKYKNGQYVWTKKIENLYNKYFDPIQIFRGRINTSTDVLLVGGDLGTSLTYDLLVENNASYYLELRGIRTGIVQLTGVDESEQDDNGNIIKKVTRYYYDSQKDVKPSRVERSQSDGTQEVEHLIYPTAYASSSGEGSFLSSLVSKNIVDYPIEHVFRRNGQVKAGTVNLFNSNGTLASVYTLAGAISADAGFKLSNRPQGNYVSDATTNTAFSKSSLYSSKTTVSRYDSYGNPLCITDTESGQTVCYIWSYTGLYPIAEIRNATYDAVKSALGTTPESYSSQSFPNMTAVNALRTNSQLKNAQVTTYTYELLKGMTSSTDPTGLTTYYSYDSQGRLSKIYIKEGGTDKTIKEYLYNYKVK